jgi:hypothetical protein
VAAVFPDSVPENAPYHRSVTYPVCQFLILIAERGRKSMETVIRTLEGLSQNQKFRDFRLSDCQEEEEPTRGERLRPLGSRTLSALVHESFNVSAARDKMLTGTRSDLHNS